VLFPLSRREKQRRHGEFSASVEQWLATADFPLGQVENQGVAAIAQSAILWVEPAVKFSNKLKKNGWSSASLVAASRKHLESRGDA